MFRPEMLLPMGLPEGVNCIGFGLSLERPTMIKYKIDNIRKRYFSFVAIYDRENYEIILKGQTIEMYLLLYF